MALKKNNIAMGLILLITLSAGIIIGSYIPKIETVLEKREVAEKEAKIMEQLKKDRVLNEKDFSIGMPAGWAGINPMPGTSATIAYINEQITDPALNKINFRSYYAITYDTLNKRTLLGYNVYLKNTLAKLLPGIKITKETSEKINGKDARFIEAAVMQRGTNFNVLVATILGNKDDVWTLSFNIGAVNWEAYKDMLYSIARTFTLKTAEEIAAAEAAKAVPTTAPGSPTAPPPTTTAPNAQK
jgi:hypothetical protein